LLRNGWPLSSGTLVALLRNGWPDSAGALIWQPAEWVFCDRCGTSVDTVLIHPDGHHYSNDGDFYCADCWEALAAG
jgi:hypothetical protein